MVLLFHAPLSFAMRKASYGLYIFGHSAPTLVQNKGGRGECEQHPVEANEGVTITKNNQQHVNLLAQSSGQPIQKQLTNARLSLGVERFEPASSVPGYGGFSQEPQLAPAMPVAKRPLGAGLSPEPLLSACRTWNKIF